MIQELEYKHQIAIGIPPKSNSPERSVAIVSASNSGSTGELNSKVLLECGYSLDDFPGSQLRKKDFHLLYKEGLMPILFIVTVGKGFTKRALENNLRNAIIEYKEFLDGKSIWIPLMGTGAGGLTIIESYSITVRTLNSLHSFISQNTSFIIALPESGDAKKLIDSINIQKSEIKIQEKQESESINNSFKLLNYYLVGFIWDNVEQEEEFYKNSNWINAHDKRVYAAQVNGVKVGDILILKTVNIQKDFNLLRIKGVGVVNRNPLNGTELEVNWILKNIVVDIRHLGSYRSTISKVQERDIDTILNHIGKTKLVQVGIFNPINVTADIKITSNNVKEIISKIATQNNVNFWWLNANPNRWRITDFKVGQTQSYSIRNEKGNQRRNFSYFFEVQPGELILGYETTPTKKIIALFEVVKPALNRDNDVIVFRILYFFSNQTNLETLTKIPEFRDSEVFSNPTGSLFKLTNAQFTKIIETTELNANYNSTVSEVNQYQGNILKKPSFNNDGSQSEKDLLGFENDLRSFASLIALKELKPPLAIALFGKWGSGKSFFMYNLQKRIEFLSKHQGFEEFIEQDANAGEPEEPFCRGVVHIWFNAWSYMDANLWASLVANIFEKLDEYISGQKKSDDEKNEIRKKLNENLSFVNKHKNAKLAEKENLIGERSKLIEKIKKLEESKEKILEAAVQKKYSDLYNDVKQKIKINDTVKSQLSKYGVTNERIAELSPESLYNEVRSWGNFLINICTFSKSQLIIPSLSILLLLFTWVNPSYILNNIFEFVNESIIYIFSIFLPIVIKLFSTINQWRKIYRPLKDYRDKFNHELEMVHKNNRHEMELINEQIKQKTEEIDLKSTQVNSINDSIEIIEYELDHYVTKKAFFDFVKNKSKDEKYNQNLSIITIIRRDFETLSDLFRDYNIPPNISEEEREKIEEKKRKSEEFKKLFDEDKPLDRIVLYIDDLDRCPEERVIEVLEAVNLLMAFPLFVVVVGVDPRWVKNALIKKYTLQFTGLLNNTDKLDEYGVEPIHVTDYLEKIFQIPFHLMEAAPGGVDKLLEDIFDGQIETASINEQDFETEELKEINLINKVDLEFPSTEIEESTGFDGTTSFMQTISHEENKKLVRFTPKDLKISQQELDDLKAMAWLIGNNPRSLKRYANMYRIIRAHENLNYNAQSERKDFLAVLFILGLAIGRYKENAESFYHKCLNNPTFDFNKLVNILNKDEEKLFLTIIKQTKAQDEMKDIMGSDFNRFIPLVKRFSFKKMENIIE